MHVALPFAGWEEVLRDFRVHISCGIHTTGWNRGFALSPTIIKQVADLGVELDFDLYAYGEDEEDDEG